MDTRMEVYVHPLSLYEVFEELSRLVRACPAGFLDAFECPKVFRGKRVRTPHTSTTRV